MENTENKTGLYYLIAGGLTTLLNIFVYDLCYRKMGFGNIESTMTAWLLAVIFAFYANRVCVFKSEGKGMQILAEGAKFFFCRAMSGIIELVWMYILVDCMHCPGTIMKACINVAVIIINYILGKRWIFIKNLNTPY